MSTVPVADTHISLTSTVRQSVCVELNQTLADLFDLHSQTKQAHWTVRGPNFWQLHEMFDKIAAVIDPFIDDVAERITALGGFPRGTARMAAESSNLPEFPDRFDDLEHCNALAERLGATANMVREQIDKTEELGDKSSADLLTEISRELDKQLWFLEAHLHRDA